MNYNATQSLETDIIPCSYEKPTRLLVGGCSFSVSPSDVSEIHKNKDYSLWPEVLVRDHDFEIINNYAMPGNGNTAIVQNLSWALTTSASVFTPEKTLIIFNITGLDRLDLMVPASHPDKNCKGSWHNILKFAWITSGGWLGQASGNSQKIINDLHKHLGWEQIVISNCLHLINFIQRLKTDQYRFYFMIMDDQIIKNSPQFFLDFLQTNKDNWIRFGEFSSMHAYGKANNLLNDDDFHLNSQGHKGVADQISNNISKHLQFAQFEPGEKL